MNEQKTTIKSVKDLKYVGSSSIALDKDLGARYAILPGDPQRVEKIANMLESPKPLAVKREYTSWEGYIDGEKVIVISTGMGGPSAAICVEELNMIGVHTVVRIGTCGGMQIPMQAGDLVIPTGAIRQEGTTYHYVYPEFPSVPNFEVVSALNEASKLQVARKTYLGVVQSKDSLYGQHSPDRMPVSDELNIKYESWIRSGALASEMECAAVFTVAQVLGMRAGAVLQVIWNKEREKAGLEVVMDRDTTSGIQTVIEGIRILMQQEKSDKKEV
ncbi:MAG: nucleoside phosphorylase [Hydrogenoanaerobacterium sp.]